MKYLVIISLFASLLYSCGKQDCYERVSNCTYVLWSYSDCTPNHWDNKEAENTWDTIRSDTFTYPVWGCPSQIEKDFYENQDQVQKDTNTVEDLRHFISQYPNTCNCHE